MNRSYLLAWAASALWAVQVILIRTAARGGQPVEGFVVATISAASVAVVAVLSHGLPKMPVGAWSSAYLSEIAGLAGLAVVFLALQRGAVGPVSMIVALYPILAAVGGWVLLGEAMTWQQVLGLVLSTIGLSLVVSAR